MCTITATELKNDLKKYMELALTEDIIVTKNGKPAAKIVSPYPRQDPIDEFLAIAGIFSNSGVDYEKLLDERDAGR